MARPTIRSRSKARIPVDGNIVLGGGVATTTGAWSIGINYDYVKASDGPSEQTGVLTLIGRI